MTENKCVSILCKICSEPVTIEANKEELKSQATGIFKVMLVHGDPLHAIVAYIDRNCKVRGIEYPDSFQVNQPQTLTVVPQEEAPRASVSDSMGEPCYQSLCTYEDVKQREQSSFILDKTVLRVICESGTICLSQIRSKIAFLEKALGEKIDLPKVQSVCEKYVKEGLVRNI
jgi:hypothetical protein